MVLRLLLLCLKSLQELTVSILRLCRNHIEYQFWSLPILGKDHQKHTIFTQSEQWSGIGVLKFFQEIFCRNLI